MSLKITPESHKKQIEEYVKIKPVYDLYAKVLLRVLQQACSLSIPEAIVQSRPKGVSSFAEKCVRKYDKYGDDAVHKMTDLCGARVIVHTLEQVKAVQSFVEANFIIVEKDDKGSLLGETTFGYRDMHYLVKLKPDRTKAIGFSTEECETIGDAIAELQVRSVVQHSWADILHDRMYKAPLQLAPEAKRTAALLAAIMEDGDRSFNKLALEIDGMTANYSAYATRENVENEIQVQRLILENEPEDKDHPEKSKKPGIALRLARLLAPCGDYAGVVEVLSVYAEIPGAIAPELLLMLGNAMCRQYESSPASDEYRQGRQYLQKAIDLLSEDNLAAVPNVRKQKSLLARAYTNMAWSLANAGDGDSAGKARICYRKALGLEPENPYYLANLLGYEIFCERSDSMVQSMVSVIQCAINTCRDHALAGIEQPFAYFTAGRLSLLLGDIYQAISWYSRGLRHYYDGKSCVAQSVLDDEMRWIDNIHYASTVPALEHSWIKQIFELAAYFNSGNCDCKPHELLQAQVNTMVIAGGANSMTETMLEKVRPLVGAALDSFHGKVISGGTPAGIPGCVGAESKKLEQTDDKFFELVGYVPDGPLRDVLKESDYDEFVFVDGDKDFSVNQALGYWSDLKKQGVKSASVLTLGIGGGEISMAEYQLALAFGAVVAVVQETSGSADAIQKDPLWQDVEKLMVVPFDVGTIEALTNSLEQSFDQETLENMAQAFHCEYVKNSPGKLPDNMRPWDKLDDTYKAANLGQAAYALEILYAAGFKVQPVGSGEPKLVKFSEEEIEKMAELEHGRWNIDRLHNGWRPGSNRDDSGKIHDCIVPWDELPDSIKQYDRWAVEAFPEILALAGLEIVK